jgi:membrane protease YdiL (CAAX protease family)
MNLKNILNTETVAYTVLAVIGILLVMLGTKFSEIAPAADKYSIIYLFVLAGLICALIDKSIAHGKLPFKRLQPVNKSVNWTIGVAIIFSALILYLFSSGTFSFIKLFAINEQAITTGGLIMAWVALFYVGGIIPSIEEELRGATLKPTIEHVLNQLGVPLSDEVSKLVNGIIFGVLHISIAAISFPLAVSAFLLSIVLDYGNQRFGYLFGLITHSTINSYVVGVVILQWGIFSLWFLPVVLVIAPYLLFTNRIKAL